MKLFTHYVITSFSYPDDYAHLEKRVALLSLSDACLRRQTCQRFRRLIIPREGIAELVRGYVRKHTETPWVLTTRLDSDDQISPQFVEKIQAAFRSRLELIDWEGYRLDVQTEQVAKSSAIRGSMFQTLSEPTAEAVGVYHARHGEMPGLFPYRRHPERLWCVVCHDTNLINSFTGYVAGPTVDRPAWATVPKL